MKFLNSSEFFDRNNDWFEKLRTKIEILLPSARIEHIGASAVKGAVSKGDLDIFVGVEPTGFPAAIDSIKSIGFIEKTDTLQTEALRMLIPMHSDKDIAIQLVANGSEFEFFIKFRDLMLSDIDLVRSYNKLKLDCSSMCENEYRDAKSNFIRHVLDANFKS